MIRVSILYPTTEGDSFDMDYYVNKHMTMVADRLGDALKGMSILEGIGGGQPGQPAPYACVGSLNFESVEAFQSAFGPHISEFMADLPNFTKASPQIQISEIRM
jgi:uncharacterized protein (TIGR02118 family)